MSTTPRTDSIAHKGYTERTYICEMTELARILETELAAMKARAEKAEADTARLNWLSVSDVWLDIPATEAFTPETMRAAIDLAMKKEAGK